MSSNICPKCSKENNEKSISCINCYASLSDNTTDPAVEQSKEMPKVSHLLKTGPAWGKILSVIAIVVIVLAVAGWWLFLKLSSPDQVVKNMFAASKSGDIEKLKSCFSEGDLQLMAAYPGTEQQIAQSITMSAYPNEEFEVGTTVYQGDIAIVGINPIDEGDNGPNSLKVELALVKENGKWKISGSETVRHMVHGNMGAK